MNSNYKIVAAGAGLIVTVVVAFVVAHLFYSPAAKAIRTIDTVPTKIEKVPEKIIITALPPESAPVRSENIAIEKIAEAPVVAEANETVIPAAPIIAAPMPVAVARPIAPKPVTKAPAKVAMAKIYVPKTKPPFIAKVMHWFDTVFVGSDR